ncbi:MAG TPA: hypothetical protein DEQ61_19420 [Streptomyces sp.]|nr:hypothetical protein [Streptomyces sp.]
MQDLERLRQMCTLVRGGVPAAQAAQVVQNAPNGPAVGAPRAFREPVTAAELTQAMHALDTAAVTRMVSAALSDRGAVPAWTHIFEPVLTSMGTHWERTGCGVEAEHVTSGLMEAGLRSHADGCAGRRSPRAPILLAATPGERHVLPLAALAAALAECGQTSVLSSDLPARALRDAITRIRPAAVVLWARTTGFADPQCL